MKCENGLCEHRGQSMIDIRNYVVKYASWEAFNCCSEECAVHCAEMDGIKKEDITEVN